VKPVLRRCLAGGLLLLVLGTALFVYLRRGASPEALMASATQYMARHEPKAAIVQLKALLAERPQSAEARFLMGSALFESGDSAAALVELRKALELGQAPDDAVPVLARALLANGQAGRLLADHGKTRLSAPRAIAELQASLALAHAEQGARDAARAALDAALAADPASPRARIVEAAFIAEARQLDAAFARLDEVLRSTPDSHEAWQMKGDLLFMARHDPDAAIAAQRQALKVRDDLIGARASIIAILLAKPDVAAARQELAALQRVAPQHPRTLYFEADMALRQGDLQTAQKLTERLRQGAPDNAQVLRLAGSVALLTGSLRSAEDLLTKALKAAPANTDTRRLLVQANLRLGQGEQALALLKPLLAVPQPAARDHTLAAQVHLHNGDARAAARHFEQAARLDPQDMRSRTGLALTALASGRIEQAHEQLDEIAAADSGTTADMALVSLHLSQGKFDAALTDLTRLERKQPTSALAAHWRGLIALTRRDTAAARQHFEQALARDPLYFPALVGLTELDVAQGQAAQAQQRFEAVLKRDPRHARALLAIAGLRAQAGASREEVMAWMAKAVAQAPTDVKARLALVQVQLAGGDAKAALLTAQAGVAAVPDDAELSLALARAQLATGERQQAVTTLKRLAEAQPDEAAVHLQLAGALVDTGELEAARKSFQRAVALNPGDLSARRGLMMLELSTGRPQVALSMARALQAQRGNEAVGLLYVGDIESRQKRWPAAVTAYRDSLKLADTVETAIKLHAALLASGQGAEAERFAADWRQRHPDDTALTAVLADQALARNDFAAAEGLYVAVLRRLPNNAGVLNNLAVAMTRQHKAGALAHAQKAHALEPGHPAIMDTLATALAEARQLDQAIAMQQRAIRTAPDLPKLRLTLAGLYVKAGQKAQARAELQALSRLGPRFAEQAEVEQLLRAL
jgi:putative PEP-CTERM system TPR-repeat lipoprotein